jgi:hypothetical protein
MLQQTLTRPTAIAHRFLNLITIQSKSVDFENVPLETIEIQVPSDEPLQRSARQCGTIEKKLRGSNVPFIQRYSRKNC